MARKLRVQYRGAIYHLMSRGNGKAAIFRNDIDRRSFLQTLAELIAPFVLGGQNKAEGERQKMKVTKPRSDPLACTILWWMTKTPLATPKLWKNSRGMDRSGLLRVLILTGTN